MKHVLSVQDLSCAGRCSLTVALPVISAMGCRCTVLPTAVLSTHTGFPAPFVRGLTEDLASIREHWQRIGAAFDAVSIGYLSDPEQAAAVEAFLDAFPAVTVLDPAMGDSGRLYSRITPAHVEAMKRLTRRAELVLPNVTEAAALTGLPYRDTRDPAWFRQLAEGLLALGARSAIITGVSLAEGKIGFFGMDPQGQTFSFQRTWVPKSFHGTGDLFSATVTGGLMAGLDPENAARLAAEFVAVCVSGTREVTPWGVEFESRLPWLWQKLPRMTAAAIIWGENISFIADISTVSAR